ncbi:MAG: hypothetical protein ACE5I5_09005 [Candidatus Heimdallarchaeota archaeon]
MSWDEFWAQFEAADYGEKLSIFHEYLNSVDATRNMVFEMLSVLLTETRTRGDYETFAELVERVKTMHPGIYKEDAVFYSMFLVENMTLEGEFKDLTIVLEPFAQDPEAIDEFIRVIELLMYHSRTEPLLEVMKEVYPKVMRSDEIIPPGKDEFAYRLGMFIIFKGLEKGVDRNTIHSEVANYWSAVSKTYVEDLVARLQGEISESWRREEFIKGILKKKEIEEKILNLTIVYMRWLTERGMSFSRTLLARDSLVEYLLGREHYPRVKKGGHLLLPMKAPLDRHFANYLSFLNHLPYRVASLVEALPGYYEYLIDNGLIDETEFRRKLKVMKSLKEDVMNYFSSASDLEKEILSDIEAAWREY